MKARALAVLLAGLGGGAAPAAAGGFEAAVQLGASLPFYSQSFDVDPNRWVPPGFPVGTADRFGLDATGGLSIAGGATWYLADSVGVEARVDSAAIDLALVGGDVAAGSGVLPPSAGLSAQITGDATLDRLTALSLNLRLRFGGRAKGFVSGGLSYLPSTEAGATVRAQAVVGLPGLPAITLPAVGVSAQGNLDATVGGNVGAGVEWDLSERAGIVAEGRAFLFSTRTLDWGPATGGQSPVETALAAALDPIELEPGFFQVTAGVRLRF